MCHLFFTYFKKLISQVPLAVVPLISSQSTCLTQAETLSGSLSIPLHSKIVTEFGLQLPNCARLTTPCKKPSSYKVTAWPLSWQRHEVDTVLGILTGSVTGGLISASYLFLSLVRGDNYSCRQAGDWKDIYSVWTMCCVIGQCVVVTNPVVFKSSKGTLG